MKANLSGLQAQLLACKAGAFLAYCALQSGDSSLISTIFGCHRFIDVPVSSVPSAVFGHVAFEFVSCFLVVCILSCFLR